MITLYDIASNLPLQACSPSTWRIRHILNYKGLDNTTIWVEFPDVEGVAKNLGLGPTTKKPDGSDWYTLPIIVDDSTGKTIGESLEIAKYLDDTYPDLPILPAATREEHIAIAQGILTSLPKFVAKYNFPMSVAILNPASLEYFVESRTKMFGMPLDQVKPTGAAFDEGFRELQVSFDKIYTEHLDGRDYVLGPTPGWADIVLASLFIWFKQIWGESSQEWKALIQEWQDGKWGLFIQRFERYQNIQ